MSWLLTTRDPALLSPITRRSRCRITRGLLASSLLAVSIVAGATAPASAADLSGSSEYGSPYDDPRYADIYRHPPPRQEVYRDSYKDDDAPRRHADDDDYNDDDDDAPPARHVERDRDYLPPMRPERRFVGPRTDRRNDDCVPRHVIRDRLSAAGWRDFQDVTIDGEIAILSARRPSGRLFELEIHRCSGEIVEARPQNSHAYGRRRFPSRS